MKSLLARQFAVLSVGIALTTPIASAAAYSISDTQLITGDGQLFNFELPLPTSFGAAGVLTIVLAGDYSPRSAPPLAEGATVSVEGSGILELHNSNSSAAVFSNSVTGLSLSSSSYSGGGNLTVLTYKFALSAGLLHTILADSLASVDVQNTDDVNLFDATGRNDVTVGFSYDISPGPPPVPPSGNAVPDSGSSAILFGLSLFGLGWFRRGKRA